MGPNGVGGMANGVDGMANSVDADQKQSMPFAKTCLSENSGSLQYMYIHFYS